MATVAASLPRPRGAKVVPALLLAALCILAGGLYAWMRVPVGQSVHGHLAHFCTDLSMAPQDWPCRVSSAQTTLTYVGGSLTIWLALALPGSILAASGRRGSAVVPIALGALATMVVVIGFSSRGEIVSLFGLSETILGSGDSRAYWAMHQEAAALVDFTLASVPPLAIALVVRPRRRLPPEALPRAAAWLATFTIAGAVVVVRWALARAPSEFFATPLTDEWVAIGVIAVFGAMLGPDRRWWPWSIAPVALLLSLGPAMAAMSVPTTLTAFTWFGGVVPLALVGFLGSLWRPVGTWFARLRSPRAPFLRLEPVAEPARPAAVRPVVVLNAAAAAMLAISVLAARADPLPIQIATPLPTYLGQRELAQDVRAKTNLSEALAAMEAYLDDHGTYRGFDAAAGEAVAPELAWTDKRPGNDLVVGIMVASGRRAQVVALSGSNTAFCAQTVGGRWTVGSAGQERVGGARAACGAESLTPDTLRMFDVSAMCTGVDEGAIVLCRSVQRLIREILASPIARY